MKYAMAKGPSLFYCHFLGKGCVIHLMLPFLWLTLSSQIHGNVGLQHSKSTYILSPLGFQFLSTSAVFTGEGANPQNVPQGNVIGGIVPGKQCQQCSHSSVRCTVNLCIASSWWLKESLACLPRPNLCEANRTFFILLILYSNLKKQYFIDYR